MFGTEYQVIHLHAVGGNVPDLLVSGFHHERRDNTWLLVELKSVGGKLTAGQQEFLETCKGPAMVAYTLADILRGFGWTEEQASLAK